MSRASQASNASWIAHHDAGRGKGNADRLAFPGERPESGKTITEALDIRIALGTPLLIVDGPTAAPVENNYRTALDLVERVGDVSRRFLVLRGLWYIRFTSGDSSFGEGFSTSDLIAAKGLLT